MDSYKYFVAMYIETKLPLVWFKYVRISLRARIRVKEWTALDLKERRPLYVYAVYKTDFTCVLSTHPMALQPNVGT